MLSASLPEGRTAHLEVGIFPRIGVARHHRKPLRAQIRGRTKVASASCTATVARASTTTVVSHRRAWYLPSKSRQRKLTSAACEAREGIGLGRSRRARLRMVAAAKGDEEEAWRAGGVNETREEERTPQPRLFDAQMLGLHQLAMGGVMVATAGFFLHPARTAASAAPQTIAAVSTRQSADRSKPVDPLMNVRLLNAQSALQLRELVVDNYKSKELKPRERIMYAIDNSLEQRPTVGRKKGGVKVTRASPFSLTLESIRLETKPKLSAMR